MPNEQVILSEYFREFKSDAPYHKAFYDYIREKLVMDDQVHFINGVPMHRTGHDVIAEQAECIYKVVREYLVEQGALDAARPY